ncbi:MAG TPA: 6,7-dimethyl-8-ribityllumazine synthase [Gaiellaceae bacterium]|nr:6,7-dimethyl-8-ribityllumazine synthase [Gaiellaceae bacterium]
MSEQWPGDEPDEPEEADAAEGDADDEPELRVVEHDEADGLHVPDDVELLEGEVRGTRRGVGIVLSRANAAAADAMLQAALEELDAVHVGREHVTVMLVPGAFELALGAMALAKTRRYACIVALGDATDHGVIASETASGLQLAALETGVPVAFGVLIEAGDAAERATEAVRRALEMSDLFQQLRAAAKAH